MRGACWSRFVVEMVHSTRGLMAAAGRWLPVVVLALAGSGTVVHGFDCNLNGIGDDEDLSAGTSQDCDGDGIPDECLLVADDCNQNGVPDGCDVGSGTSLDCNENGVPDECDIKPVLTFGAPTTYAVDVSPFSIPAIDLDEDGDLELVTANRGAGFLSIFDNLGEGRFKAPTKHRVGERPHHIAPADLNADGHIDLAVGNRGSGEISIVLGKGDGTFEETVNVRTCSDPNATNCAPRTVVPVDLDGDGDLDLAVVNRGPEGQDVVEGDFTVLLNDGNAVFTKKDFNIKLGVRALGSTSWDFELDGDADVAATVGATSDVVLLTNDGDANFTILKRLPVGENPSSVTAVDLDADDDLDLVVTNERADTLSVLMNVGGPGTTDYADQIL